MSGPRLKDGITVGYDHSGATLLSLVLIIAAVLVLGHSLGHLPGLFDATAPARRGTADPAARLMDRTVRVAVGPDGALHCAGTGPLAPEELAARLAELAASPRPPPIAVEIDPAAGLPDARFVLELCARLGLTLAPRPEDPTRSAAPPMD